MSWVLAPSQAPRERISEVDESPTVSDALRYQHNLTVSSTMGNDNE